MSFPNGHDRQTRDQGQFCARTGPALVHRRRDTTSPGSDVGADAALLGLVVFMFTAYSAGTPKWEDFPRAGPAGQLAPNAFTAQLPQRLLGHPKEERWQSSATST